MKIEITIFLITAFLIYNTYHDGKITNMLKLNAKNIKMAGFAFGALSLYIFIKRFPEQGKNMFLHANDMIKYMPIDKNTADIITPLLNFTNEKHIYGNQTQPIQHQTQQRQHPTQQPTHPTQPTQHQIQNKNKRSVSETKKKYVASNQMWKCGHCNQQLDHTFEVDHVLDLQYGGSNNVDNLVALCRNCHGKKTMKRHIL